MTLYRNKTEAPTKSGLYYARRRCYADIYVVEVHACQAHLFAWEFGADDYSEIDNFDWFGPVEECKEG